MPCPRVCARQKCVGDSGRRSRDGVDAGEWGGRQEGDLSYELLIPRERCHRRPARNECYAEARRATRHSRSFIAAAGAARLQNDLLGARVRVPGGAVQVCAKPRVRYWPRSFAQMIFLTCACLESVDWHKTLSLARGKDCTHKCDCDKQTCGSCSLHAGSSSYAKDRTGARVKAVSPAATCGPLARPHPPEESEPVGVGVSIGSGIGSFVTPARAP